MNEIAARPTFRTIDGLSIRFVESEPRNTDALLLSPWPESVLAYKPIWSRLAQHTHLVAIDLPGFGRSERREALMSPRAMGEFLVHAADAFGSRNRTSLAQMSAVARHGPSRGMGPTTTRATLRTRMGVPPCRVADDVATIRPCPRTGFREGACETRDWSECA